MSISLFSLIVNDYNTLFIAAGMFKSLLGVFSLLILYTRASDSHVYFHGEIIFLENIKKKDMPSVAYIDLLSEIG